MARRAVFPGSFDPLTIAHLGIADRVRIELTVDSVDLVISEVALAKERGHAESVAVRLASIRHASTAGRPWLRATVTSAQLLVDIADGYDVLVLGADKWHQLLDPSFYGDSPAARDDALARLPVMAVAPRTGAELPTDLDRARFPDLHVLRTDPGHHEVSSTAVRSGRHEWLGDRSS